MIWSRCARHVHVALAARLIVRRSQMVWRSSHVALQASAQEHVFGGSWPRHAGAESVNNLRSVQSEMALGEHAYGYDNQQTHCVAPLRTAVQVRGREASDVQQPDLVSRLGSAPTLTVRCLARDAGLVRVAQGKVCVRVGG